MLILDRDITGTCFTKVLCEHCVHTDAELLQSCISQMIIAQKQQIH